MKYRITFGGRLKGTIGVFESFDVTVDAANADEALAACTTPIEHISAAVVEKAPRNYTFGEWMTAVNNEVQAIIGLGIADLEDHPFRDWFTDEMTPAEAAHIAIEYTGGGDLL